MKAYVASPLGFFDAGKMYMYNQFIPTLQSIGITVLDPWTLTPEAEIRKVLAIEDYETRKAAWVKQNKLIGERNARAIMDSDIVIAILDGPDVDSGTSAEIGYAYALRKKIYGFRSDFRLSADNIGATVNLQVEYFIRQSGGNIYSSFDSFTSALRNSLEL